MGRLSPNIHPKLTGGVVELLNSKKIYTIIDFIKCDVGQIKKITKLTFKEVVEIRKYVISKYSAQPRNVLDYYRTILESSTIISTGIKGVDKLLEGGLFTGNVYEICGLPASGKTVFCCTVTKNVIFSMKQNIYFLDTKQNFRARKFKHMMSSLNEEQFVQCMSRLLVKAINTKYDLINSLFEIKNELKNGLKLRVIIIDSLPAVLLDSSDHTENNNILSQIVNVMHYIAIEHHVAFLVTNIITLWNDGDFKTKETAKEKIACGKYWRGVPNTRLKIEKSRDSDNCKVEILKSPIMPQVNTIEVALTDEGFV